MPDLATLLFWLKVAGALAAALGLLAVLHFTPGQFKRVLIIGLTFVAGLFYVLEFFVPPDPVTEAALLGPWNLTDTVGTIGRVTQVVAGFTFLLGVFNLARIHGNNIRRLRAGWHNSAAFFVAFLAMTITAVWRDWNTWFPANPVFTPLWINDIRPENAALPHDAYTLLFQGLWRNLEATMFSILAFYIVSAAYRAFRVRSGEAAVLMIVAVILMMGQVPLGMALTNWIPPEPGPFAILRIESFSQYVLVAINGPVQRAIEFGIGLGSLAMALRIWLSLERGTYFDAAD
ncbi:MAG: hypothetical protein ACK47B_09830 [Armatimonadota bacterium]